MCTCKNSMGCLYSTKNRKNNNTIKVLRISDNAFIPVKSSKDAAGYDLFSAYAYVVPKNGGKIIVKTDLSVSLPKDTYGRIAERSGLAWKYSMIVGGGVIDRDYRGNVCVILFNLGTTDFKIAPGDRIAQLVIEKCMYCEIYEVSELNITERNDSGFGSTGL